MNDQRDRLLQQLANMGLSPKRSLGQNFLISERIIAKIVKEVADSSFENWIEIGPGLGALTSLLVVKKNLKVIEQDRVFAEYWRNKGVEVIEEDALKTDWERFLGPFGIVGNLPYQISSRLLIDLSVKTSNAGKLVFMFQKEVAQRILATPRSEHYGLLSVVAQVYWTPKLLLEAGSVDFYPQPRVASRVVVFDNKKHLTKHIEFFRWIKVAFSQRRKKMIKALRGEFKDVDLDKVLAQAKVSTDVRAEELSPDQHRQVFEASREDLASAGGN